MKFVKKLSEAELNTLSAAYQNHPQHRVRQRAHALLLSHIEYPIKQLSLIFNADRDTISQWIDAWESRGIRGLYDKPRSGRPSLFDEQDQALLRTLLVPEQRLDADLQTHVAQKTGKKFSSKTLKRVRDRFNAS